MQMGKVWGTFFNAGVNSDKTTNKLGLEKSFRIAWHAIIRGRKKFYK
ncbi:hypothetical protein QFZ73_001521 [Peribacillus sp. V2I11]|nr:hypothetical protein [Peribacillus sp. V2I11]